MIQHNRLARCLRAQRGPMNGRRGFGSSSSAYDATLAHLRIGGATRVLFQGFTGRQATANAQESLAWGTRVVGGVTPGRSGTHLGLPLLPSVRAAVAALRPDATGIYVPAALAAAAIEEAVAAEVPLVVAVAEHLPLHAQLRVQALLRTQRRSRLVGANSPGVLSAVGRCRIGFQPLSVFAAASSSAALAGRRVGIAARSGTLSYEAAAAVTRAGLGQSLCIGVGGDLLAGTTLPEALAVLAADPDTDAIALVGEIGGDSELQAAAWAAAYRRNTGNTDTPKPIAALVAGTHAVPGRIMGHAGAVRLPGDPSAADKIRAFAAAGVTVVHHPEQFGTVLRAELDALARRPPPAAAAASSSFPPSQKRSMHTAASAAAGRRLWGPSGRPHAGWLPARRPQQQQTRTLYLGDGTSADLLRAKGVATAEADGHAPFYLAISIDRTARSPCVLAAPAVDVAGGPAGLRPTDSFAAATPGIRSFPFAFDPADADGRRGDAIDAELVRRVAAYVGPAGAGERGDDASLQRLLRALYSVFREQQAYLVEAAVAVPAGDAPETTGLVVVQARMALDDVAFAQRPAEDAVVVRAAAEAPEADAAVQAEAQEAGIVYLPLGDPEDAAAAAPRIGTLVNGAGLAMNTVDALAARGGRAANFLDTGGKATSETVRACFALLQRDARVRVVLVNVFGGLTRGDMIARGILLACAGDDMPLPVVVRLRGTNEAEGQAILRASGLPRLYAFDSFADAAAKAIELAGE